MQPTAHPLTTPEKTALLDRILTDRTYDIHKETIEALAKDDDAAVREQALETFWKLVDPDFIDLDAHLITLDPGFLDTLLDIADADPAPEVRIEATRALGRYVYEGFRMENLSEDDYKKVKEFLLNLFNDHSGTVDSRRTALEALGYITDPDVEALIREAHASPDRKMRISALFAMGRSGMDRAWEDILVKEIHSHDPEIRFEAVRSAGETYSTGAAEALERLTGDPDRRTRIEAIRALGNAGRPDSRLLLRTMLSSSDEDVRDAASEALNALDYFQCEPFTDE